MPACLEALNSAVSATTRRTLGITMCMALCLALGVLGGCASAAPGRVPDSQLNFNRTFDTALGAMVDQKLVISHQDRRQGTVIGALGGATLTATLEPMLDGTIRVWFRAQGDSPADEALLKRVAEAYNARMGQARLLPGGLL